MAATKAVHVGTERELELAGCPCRDLPEVEQRIASLELAPQHVSDQRIVQKENPRHVFPRNSLPPSFLWRRDVPAYEIGEQVSIVMHVPCSPWWPWVVGRTTPRPISANRLCGSCPILAKFSCWCCQQADCLASRLLGLASPHALREWMQHEGLVVEAERGRKKERERESDA